MPDKQQHDFIIGVFGEGGKLINSDVTRRITCTHAEAGFLVALLDMGKAALPEGYYFAVDYYSNVFK